MLAPPSFLQAELKQHLKGKQSVERELMASQAFCTKSEMQNMKKKVEAARGLMETMPTTPALSTKAPRPALADIFECIVCLSLPPKAVFMCTKCEGTLCESCKTQFERTHEQSGTNEPLNCPQCRTVFVSPGNPIRSRKTETLIRNLPQR